MKNNNIPKKSHRIASLSNEFVKDGYDAGLETVFDATEDLKDVVAKKMKNISTMFPRESVFKGDLPPDVMDEIASKLSEGNYGEAPSTWNDYKCDEEKHPNCNNDFNAGFIKGVKRQIILKPEVHDAIDNAWKDYGLKSRQKSKAYFVF